MRLEKIMRWQDGARDEKGRRDEMVWKGTKNNDAERKETKGRCCEMKERMEGIHKRSAEK